MARNAIQFQDGLSLSAFLKRYGGEVEDEAARKLDGRVEMDDAVLGGEKAELEGGKRGRKGPNKVPFVIAVATSDEGRPQRLFLQVAEHTGEDIERVARAHLAPSARVVSDGLGCFRAV